MKVLAFFIILVGIAFGKDLGTSEDRGCLPPTCIHRSNIKNIQENRDGVTATIRFEGEGTLKEVHENRPDISYKDSVIKATRIEDVLINTKNIENTLIQAPESLKTIRINATNDVKKTQIDSASTSDINISGNKHEETAIKGTASLNNVLISGTNVTKTRLDGASIIQLKIQANVIREFRVSGTDISGVELHSAVVNDVFIEGSKVKSVVINAPKPETGAANINEVHIKGKERLDDIVINGTHADVKVVTINEVTVNQNRPSYLLHCVANYGQAQREGTPASSCEAELCKSNCVSKKWQEGSCYGHTCCCITDQDRKIEKPASGDNGGSSGNPEEKPTAKPSSAAEIKMRFSWLFCMLIVTVYFRRDFVLFN